MLFLTQTKLLNRLHAARAVGNFERRLQQLVRVPLIIVDDFALKPITTTKRFTTSSPNDMSAVTLWS